MQYRGLIEELVSRDIKLKYRRSFLGYIWSVLNPLLVMTGTHYGLIPIGTNNLATVKWDTVVGPGMLASNVAQGAAGLAVGIRSKNADTKQQASSAGLVVSALIIVSRIFFGTLMFLRIACSISWRSMFSATTIVCFSFSAVAISSFSSAYSPM